MDGSIDKSESEFWNRPWFIFTHMLAVSLLGVFLRDWVEEPTRIIIIVGLIVSLPIAMGIYRSIKRG